MHFTIGNLSFLFSILLGLILSAYVLLLKRLRGTAPILSMLFFTILWSVGFMLQDFSADPVIRLLGQQFYHTSQSWLPVTWLIFIYYFQKKNCWLTPKLLVAFAVPAVVFTILLWTNPFHGLYYHQIPVNETATSNFNFSLQRLGVISLLYSYLIVLISIAFLFKELITANPRGPVITLLLCTLLPWPPHIAYTLGILQPVALPLTAFLFTISAILFIFGLWRYRMLDIMPVGYPSIIAGLQDAIIVLDRNNQVVHINRIAEQVLGKSARSVINLPIRQALSGIPQLLELCCIEPDVKSEPSEMIQLKINQRVEYFELQQSKLSDRFNNTIGLLVILHNISQRVEAENFSRRSQSMLQVSEERYRSLVENINEVFFTMDPDGRFTYVSPVIERYIGLTPDKMINRPIHDYVDADDIEHLGIELQQVSASNPIMIEFRMLDQQNRIHYVLCNCILLTDPGQPPSIHGTLTDITERKLVEEALERRVAQLDLLNYIGEQIAAVIELNSVLDSATDLIQKHFGYYHVAIFTPDEGQNALVMRSTSGYFSKFFPKNHHLGYGQGMVGWTFEHKTMLLANDVYLEPRYTNLYPDRILTRSELAVPIMVSEKLVGILDIQSPLVNAFDENDVRVMKTVADQIAVAMENARLYEEVRRQLREREQKENMLRIQRDLLMKLSATKGLEETLQVAVEALAEELHTDHVLISLINWVNQLVEPVVSIGYSGSPQELTRSIDNSIAGWVARNAIPALIPNILDDKRQNRALPETVSLLCVPLISNDKVIGVISLESNKANAFSQDDLRLMTTLANSLVVIIERARLFEEVEQGRSELEKRATELEEANASLRELDRFKSQFVANMSHELRTPLNSIIGFSEIMEDEIIGPLNMEQKESIRDILESGKHLLALINDLLDFSKIEAGRMTIEPSCFEVNDLFEELRITISALIEKKSQTLVFRLDGNLPPLTADHLRIKQVFINLLSNANKFTGEGGTITVSCQLKEPGRFLFSVSDTGIGIRLEDQQMIFEEFRQVDGSMTREVNGTGLGLAISKRIIELHHGEIQVKSDLGSGSTFYVLLPVVFEGESEQAGVIKSSPIS